MKYKVQTRYFNETDEFGDWGVNTFNSRLEATKYLDRLANRYATKEEKYHLEGRVVEVTEEESEKFNEMMRTLYD